MRIELPRDLWEKMNKHKVIYRTLDLSTGKFGVARAKEVDEVLKE